MGIFAFGGDGPNFLISLKEAEIINEKGFMNFKNDNLHARISITEHDPNFREFPNGYQSLIDGECNKGVRLRRYPENICPHDFKGNQFYVLRIKRNFLEEIMDACRRSSYPSKSGFIHPRCKYDRFALVITDI